MAKESDPLLMGLNADDIAVSQAMAKRDYLQHWQVVGERSRYVRQRIVETMEKMNAPLALQVVPVVESGYNPYALSHAGAMGLWQLMPRTAHGLGIRASKHVDGRRSVEQATEAAVSYLMDMKKRFNSWPLAIAAYHMGPNGLSRRLQKSPWQTSDGLDAIPAPAITRAYVKHIVGLASLLRMQVISFPDPYETTAIQLKPPVDIEQLSLACGMDKHDLFFFNPGLNQAQYLTRSIEVHVPLELVAAIDTQMQLSGPKYVKTTVRAGDSMWQIAHQHHITVAHLKRLNPAAGNVLRPGQRLSVPANRLARATASANPLLSQGRRIHYKVRSGDSLWSIAQRFGTTAKAIARFNRLSQRTLIRPGDTLWVLARIRRPI
ncbi:MAG TPA: LysM peptidoglycan-binding domain-containing protein [Mariprofundaceae bacterium]|nr:LysM peptidoglycan-binding domain-containing protein [Mariprofundaceae bacterium]